MKELLSSIAVLILVILTLNLSSRDNNLGTKIQIPFKIDKMPYLESIQA